MTRMTGPDCAVMCNLKNRHTYIHTYSKRMDQSGKVANPARGQLDRENYPALFIHSCLADTTSPVLHHHFSARHSKIIWSEFRPGVSQGVGRTRRTFSYFVINFFFKNFCEICPRVFQYHSESRNFLKK